MILHNERGRGPSEWWLVLLAGVGLTAYIVLAVALLKWLGRTG